MSKLGPAAVEVASVSHIGRVRATNQDSCGEFANDAGWRALVVADGMGGHQAGEVASRIAVETIGQVLRARHEAPERALREAFLAANERVREVASSDPRYAGMGTTGVALLLTATSDAWVSHVGDSRAYLFRGGRLIPLTADHSYVAELQRRGFISAAEAAIHPRRNEVLRSIGGEPDLEVEVRPVAALPGDCFLLCTDGLWGCVPEAEVAGALASASPQEAARMLVDLANHHGGPDNVTVQLALIPEQADASPGLQESTERERAVVEGASASFQDRIWRPPIAPSLTLALVALLLLWVLLHFAAKNAPSPRDPTPSPAAPPGRTHP